MKKTILKIGAVSVLALVLSNCGQSPFGPGNGDLSLFAKIGKAMGKPSSINDEQNDKQTAKAMVAEGQQAAKRLAKGESGSAWLVSQGIEKLGGDTLKYWEVVTNKPSEDDADKLVSGRGEVLFGYSGTFTSGQDIDGNLITKVYKWGFVGTEYKTWKAELCSIRATVDFKESLLSNPLPGMTKLYAKNISGTREKGEGDTVYMFVDSLDQVKSSQFGGGTFYDKYTGSDNNGPSATFSFNLEVLHKNTYTDWNDNEGIMTFMYPWGNSGDSLHFMIHFYPNYERSGEVRKNGATGPVLVKFTGNDKTGASTAIYYDEEGKEIDRE
ncbi:MAG: hypothetical protein JNL74_06180 [Fibrobacteres bacterium]|nr:hypothetical protein [Fibrobacterota bacterium]